MGGTTCYKVHSNSQLKYIHSFGIKATSLKDSNALAGIDNVIAATYLAVFFHESGNIIAVDRI